MNEARKAELEVIGPMYLQALCQGAGLDTSGSKEELIDRLLESEGQVSAEKPEVSGEPGEAGEGSEEPGEAEEPTGETEPAEPSEPES